MIPWLVSCTSKATVKISVKKAGHTICLLSEGGSIMPINPKIKGMYCNLTGTLSKVNLLEGFLKFILYNTIEVP